LRGALQRAVARRENVGRGRLTPPGNTSNTKAGSGDPALHQSKAAYRRLVWSESDELPGVVVDQFGDTAVLQIQTLAMDGVADLLAKLVVEVAGVAEVIFRNDSNLRRLEGLPLEVRTLSGREWEPRWAT